MLARDYLSAVVNQVEADEIGPPRTASGPPAPDSGSTGGSRVESWATPRAAEVVNGKNIQGGLGLTSQMLAQTGGKLNPSWVETLQGFPIGWTQLPMKFVKPRKETP
jgi:hypothetical protein